MAELSIEKNLLPIAQVSWLAIIPVCIFYMWSHCVCFMNILLHLFDHVKRSISLPRRECFVCFICTGRINYSRLLKVTEVFICMFACIHFLTTCTEPWAQGKDPDQSVPSQTNQNVHWAHNATIQSFYFALGVFFCFSACDGMKWMKTLTTASLIAHFYKKKQHLNASQFLCRNKFHSLYALFSLFWDILSHNLEGQI